MENAEAQLIKQTARTERAWLQRIIPDLERLHAACAELGGDLMLGDMPTLATALRGFQPDLVLELGRGYGSSTALFRYLNLPVVSICHSSYWQQTTAKLSTMFDIDWNKGVNAIVGEIGEQDYAAWLQGSQRPFIFWDAHGYDVADVVLRQIVPSIFVLPARPIDS